MGGDVACAVHAALGLDFQQAGFGGEATCKARQCAIRTDHAVAWRDDGNGIFPIRSAHGTHRLRVADLLRDLRVIARFAERNGEQGIPHLLLKFSASEIERQGKFGEIPRKIRRKLVLCLDQHGVGGMFLHRAEADAVRIVIFPKDRS